MNMESIKLENMGKTGSIEKKSVLRENIRSGSENYYTQKHSKLGLIVELLSLLWKCELLTFYMKFQYL